VLYSWDIDCVTMKLFIVLCVIICLEVLYTARLWFLKKAEAYCCTAQYINTKNRYDCCYFSIILYITQRDVQQKLWTTINFSGKYSSLQYHYFKKLTYTYADSPSGNRQVYHSAILRSAHTLYLCVLCGSQNKQRLFPYTTLTGLYNRDGLCLLRGTDWMLMCCTM
jgi:hypothetical protein